MEAGNSSFSEALQWLPYHVSTGHTMPCDETMVIAFAPQAHNYAHNLAVKAISHFQRGYSVQILQVHAPQAYRLTTWECSTMKTMYLSYNVVDKFDQYSWQTGLLWIYGHVVHVQTMLSLPTAASITQSCVWAWRTWGSMDKASCPMRCNSCWASTKPPTRLTPTQSGSPQSVTRDMEITNNGSSTTQPSCNKRCNRMKMNRWLNKWPQCLRMEAQFHRPPA